MFVVVAVFIMAFALHGEDLSPDILAGIFWVVIYFSAMSGLSRIFVSEEDRNTIVILHLVASSTSIYFGKLIFNCILTMILSLAVSALFFLVFPSFSVQSTAIFFTTLFLGNIGLAAASTILAAIISKTNSSGTLYPVLSFPLLIPLLMTVIKSTGYAMRGEMIGGAMAEFQILIAYILVITSGSYLLFDYVWKE